MHESRWFHKSNMHTHTWYKCMGDIIFEWVISCTWMSHVTHHMIGPCHTREWFMSRHTYAWVTSHICMSHVTHMHESRHTYAWVTSYMNKSYLACERDNVTPHLMEACHTCEYFMSHKCTIHMTLDVTHHMTLEWVIPHHTMDESHHPHICFRTHIWFTTYMWFVAHIVTSYMNESYLACERVHVTHHISGSHQTMNDSNHTRKWFTAHVCMSHVIHEGVISCM